MASLGSWNRIDNVLTGLPFSSGSAGSATVSSDGNTRATATGTINTTSLTIGSAILSNGDTFLIHQTQGTGAGQYEFNKVVSGGGTTSITTLKPLKYGYVSGAQVVLFSQYMTATVSGYTGTAWNGSTGGVGVICARNSITVSGAVSWNGKGFRGGSSSGSGTLQGNGGEGQNGGYNTGRTSADGMGAGAGKINDNQRKGGGGAGHASDGSDGGYITTSNQYGLKGTSAGSADLTVIFLGGGGGSGAGEGGTSGGTAGGNGGGVLFLISKSITMSAVASVNGDNGVSNTDAGAGGGGAGGSIVGICQTASLGTNNLTATAGSGGNGNSTADGGNGSAGRIAIHHSSTVTGTTNPTFNDTSDLTLTEKLYGASLLF